MTLSVTPLEPGELSRVKILPEAGFGALETGRGNLPLDRLAVRASISGLTARTVVSAEFVNVHDVSLEATYIFPLPDRAAVTGMTMTADGHTVEAELQERGAARETYDRAIAEGKRASIAEEERPDVFTMRVGNLVPGERVTVELRLVGPLPYEDGAATFRFPLVVAPRYVPGIPLPGTPVGAGHEADTDAAPDASRISPPVLLPGFPNPLRLSIDVEVDPAGLELGDIKSSLHAVVEDERRISIRPGERADRDFILRLAYAPGGRTAVVVPDPDADADDAEQGADAEQGTYAVTVMPPEAAQAARPKDVVLLLDRSGSMGGWKMVAARRAAARVVDTLTAADRFAVLTFDHAVEHPAGLEAGLSEATDRHRFRAVEHLSRADARGGTEMLAPLREGLQALADKERDRVLVLVTDGQVGNEDQILEQITPLIGDIRVHTIGIDRAVNAGFLGRLASIGGGRAELVESEDRLDEAMEHIHRRIGAPLVTDLTLRSEGLTLVEGTRSPHRLPALYPGVPLVVAGRYSGAAEGSITVTGRRRDGGEFEVTVPVTRREEPAVAAQWARARLRDLEDRYAAGDRSLENTITATSLRFGVLCRFTAFVAVDSRVVNENGVNRRVVQPVETPSGWESAAGVVGDVAAPVPFIAMASASMPMAPPPSSAPGAPPRFAPMMARRSAGDGGFRTGSPAFAKAVAGGRARASVDLGAIAKVELERLHAAEGRPEHERAELLDDLASRLDVLAPDDSRLSELVAFLRRDDSSLPERWAEAVRVLTGLVATPEPGQRPDELPGGLPGERPSERPGERPSERKAFWKR
ncbi:VIT domain-containing protein [Actinoplanes sp. NBRC 103695]|uniref:VIT domain-containing protein n=1 Tax=Actinoplanes sp. NBRC 103695 TaxID=3032202 RepID=UPI0024A00E9C|nr:VIT domain-containing protein [Actinoplanes sp. NBRC 103695]GLY97797.1 inter-alpha-trypsin inhibitor domain-containing protein [Actinoplanes sp. NBRC 103695]